MSETKTIQPTDTARHNAYGWIKPDAATCYICGKKEYATPVDGFHVKECGKCERLVCEHCAEVDADERSIQWQCSEECLVDVRVPVTVIFDFSIENVKPGEVEETVRALEMAVVEARLENAITFDELVLGTRWQPANADMDNVGIRTHARSGSFYPWKRDSGKGIQ